MPTTKNGVAGYAAPANGPAPNVEAIIVGYGLKLEAAPGDLLLVVDGVCVGLQRGGAAGKGAPTLLRLTWDKPETSDIRERVLSTLIQLKSARCVKIGDVLGMPRSDKASRQRISVVLAALVMEGSVRKAGKSRLGPYRPSAATLAAAQKRG